jgi:hypothetical protein
MWHRTLKKSLSHYINLSGTNWDTLLPFSVMSYHSKTHSSTGYSPFYLLHGREIIMPIYENLRARLDPKIKGTDMAR